MAVLVLIGTGDGLGAGPLPDERPSKADAGQSAPTAAEKRREEKIADLRGVVEELGGTTDTVVVRRCVEQLRAGFPESRVVLHETLRTGTPAVRAFALRVLGEAGDPERDIEPVARLLRDPVSHVRLAAVMALRGLGEGSASYIEEYLPRETSHNNRKMAVRTFKVWQNPDHVPFLTRMLARENHPRVRPFIVDALESLSGERHGDDVKAWEFYSKQFVTREQKRLMLESLRDGDGEEGARDR